MNGLLLVQLLAEESAAAFEFATNVVADGREVDKNANLFIDKIMKEAVKRCGVFVHIRSIRAVTKKLGRLRNHTKMLTSVVQLDGGAEGRHGMICVPT